MAEAENLLVHRMPRFMQEGRGECDLSTEGYTA